MKTNILKISLLALSFNAFGIDLPQIQKPLELESGEFAEGTITTLSKEDIKEYLPWANNAKKNLEDALSESRRLPLSERMTFLENEVKSVVRGSAPKKYQQLMRFALNRGLLMVDILEKEADSKQIGVIQNQLDIINRSIKISFDFYESDLAFQKRATEGSNAMNIPQADLGLKMAEAFFKSSEGMFDASAQYQVMKKTFEILNWDLSQDQNSKSFSEVIVEIYKTISKLPVQVKTDQEAIKHIRTMNYLKLKALFSLKEPFALNTVITSGKDVQPSFNQKKEACGRMGIMEQRIESCNTQKGNYVLIYRSTMGKEFYRDINNGLFWGHDVGEMSFVDAKSACDRMVTLDLKWRLPTIQEYVDAERNKIRESLDFANKYWWSSTLNKSDSDYVWMFDGDYGTNNYFRRDIHYSVRCVAQE